MYRSIQYKASPHRQRRADRTAPVTPLQKLIREEENVQRLQSERQPLYERLINPATAASPQFIAAFRMKQKTNKRTVNAEMENENVQCVICLGYLKQDESYEEWPCPSPIPHIFHYNCMLESLRRKNTCPLCRHAVDAYRANNHNLYEFFARLVS